KNIELDNISKGIEETCVKIKEMIIFDELGQKSIPADFENNNMWIEESGLKDEFKDGREGEKMIIQLNELINKYNSLCDNNSRIPNTVEKIINSKIMQQSNYNILSSLSQIELYVVLNEKQ
ncbi:MAG: hypothetical protein JNM51_08330, partial [Bacteroidia bacterium]|nr:hypothetical protein [Bacteroidia bacterium]